MLMSDSHNNHISDRIHMIYCSNCGERVIEKIPAGDNRPRYVCDACQTVHYQNPKIVAGCIPVWDNRVLLCRRAIEPRYGLWTLPAGFMENGESTEQAAARETWEEACGRVTELALYGVFSIPQINQVYMMFRAQLAIRRIPAGGRKPGSQAARGTRNTLGSTGLPGRQADP